MSRSDATCVSCGARLTADAQQCSLCGWPVGVEDHDLREGDANDDIPGNEAISPPIDADAAFCHMCGWKSPSGARFCSSCGTKLQNVERTPASRAGKKKPAGEREILPTSGADVAASAQPTQRVTGGHIGMLFAGSLLVVGALYMITIFSKRAFPPIQESAAQQEAAAQPPTRGLPADVEERVARLQADIEAAAGDERLAKERELSALYAQNNRPDRAAEIQQRVAETTNDQQDWFEAGHLFYTWMDSQSGELRFAAAQRSADAFEKGLTFGDDLNVRTALAMAYLNTRAPMLGVQQIRSVLDQEPDHLQGNFYYGVMLMQINRIDQAIAQFERVKQITGADSPLYQQAEMMLQNLKTLGNAP